MTYLSSSQYPKELEGIVPKNATDQPIAYDSMTCKYLYHKYFSEKECSCTNPKFTMDEIMSGNITSNYCSNTTADCDLTKTEKKAEAKIKDECRLECETTNFKVCFSPFNLLGKFHGPEAQ